MTASVSNAHRSDNEAKVKERSEPQMDQMVSFSHRTNTSSLLPPPLTETVSASLISLHKSGSPLVGAKSCAKSPFVSSEDAECDKVGAIPWDSRHLSEPAPPTPCIYWRLTWSREFWSFTFRAAFSSSSCFISFSDFFFTSSNCSSTSWMVMRRVSHTRHKNVGWRHPAWFPKGFQEAYERHKIRKGKSARW